MWESPLELRRTAHLPGSFGSTLLVDSATFPLRALEGSSPPVLYYEIIVLDEGNKCSCFLGFGRADTGASNLPGWTNPPSIGYNGAEGQLGCHLLAAADNSAATAHLSKIGPKLTKGDVAGCGLDRAAGVVFFVVNGVRLTDIKVKGAELLVAPMVGFGALATTERVRINFGDSPFKYDHAAHKADSS
jgi:hypothetical protein